MGPNGPYTGRAGCFGQKLGQNWLFRCGPFRYIVALCRDEPGCEGELEPSVGLPCVCLPVDTWLRGSPERRFGPHSGPMWAHSGLASKCQIVEMSARRIVELSHCGSINVSKGCLCARVRPCFLACCVHCTVAARQGSISQLSGRKPKMTQDWKKVKCEPPSSPQHGGHVEVLGGSVADLQEKGEKKQRKRMQNSKVPLHICLLLAHKAVRSTAPLPQ